MAKMEYDMFQEIPAEETGSENEANGLTFEEFKDYLKSRVDEGSGVGMKKKRIQKVNYVFYKGDYPVGRIAIRPVLNRYWAIHSGNIGFTIRPSERGKGYGSEMFRLALLECKKLELISVRVQCNKNNVGSKKVIERNGGISIRKDEETLFFSIDLSN